MSNDFLDSEEESEKELDFCVDVLPKHFAHGGARVIWNHTGECIEAQCEIGDSRRRHKVIYEDGREHRFGWKDGDEELLGQYISQMSESDYKTFHEAMKFSSDEPIVLKSSHEPALKPFPALKAAPSKKLSSDERIVPKSSHEPSRKPPPARKASPSKKLSSDERIVPKSSHEPSRKQPPARKAAPSDKNNKLHSSAKPDDQKPKGSRLRRSGRDKKWYDDLVDEVLLHGTLNKREDGTEFYSKTVDKVVCTVHVESDPGTDDGVFVLTRGGRRVVYDDPGKQEMEFDRHYDTLEATLGPDCEQLRDKVKFSNDLKTTVEITASHHDPSSFFSKWWNKRKTQSAELAARKEALLRKKTPKLSSRAAKASEPGPTIVPPSHSKPPARAPKATKRVGFDSTTKQAPVPKSPAAIRSAGSFDSEVSTPDCMESDDWKVTKKSTSKKVQRHLQLSMNSKSRKLMFEKDTENKQLQSANEKLTSENQGLQSDKSMLSSNMTTALGIADKAAGAAKDAAAASLVSAQSAHLLATNSNNGGSAPVATGASTTISDATAQINNSSATDQTNSNRSAQLHKEMSSRKVPEIKLELTHRGVPAKTFNKLKKPALVAMLVDVMIGDEESD